MSLPWSSKGSKGTPINADELMIIDSADPTPSTKNKRITIGSLPSTETLTWTADHDADGFDLLNVGGITISNPADTFQYIITPDAIAADRILNIPLLTGTDTFVTAAFAQTLTNKILGNTNSIAADAIDSATLADARLSANVMLLATAQENTAAKQFRDDTLEFRNIANTFDYHVRTSAITIDRDITLPLLTGDDTFVFAAFAQTLTNKTLTLPIISSISNTGTLTLPTSTDTLVGRATTDTLTNKTLTTPTIASFTNAGHNHQNATGGGTLLSTSALSDTANIAYLDTANVFGSALKQTFTHAAGGAGIGLAAVTGDVTSPANGEFWYNDTSNKFRARENGVTVDMIGAGGGSQTPWTSNIDAATFSLLNLGGLEINNPADTFQYIITSDAIVADRILNLPLMTGTDTLVLDAFAATLTNKTLGTGTVFSVIPTINDGITFTFNPNASVSGINVGAHTAVPSTPVNGDIMYNSTDNEIQGRANGAWIDLGAAGSGAPPFSDSISIVEGSIDPTKEIRFEVDGLTTATTRVITPPDADITLVSTSDGLINNANVGGSAAIATSKLADSANFVLTNQANTFGDFAQTFADNQLFIQNPAATFEYQISAAGIAADRTITLPLLTGNDIMVTADFIQTLTNKTMTAAANTFSGFAIGTEVTGASTDLTDTAVIVRTDQTNTFGDFAQIFHDNQFFIRNPVGDFEYQIIAAAIAADRTLTLPLLTGADTFVTEDFIQTLTNKTLTTPTIASFVNAGHDHTAGAGGGQLTNTALVSGVFAAITGLGVQSQALEMGANAINNVGSVQINALSSLFLDGGGDTLFQEQGADDVILDVGGVQGFEWQEIGTEVNAVVGKLSALALSATDGFLHMSSMVGVPVGTPTAYTGKIPLVYDTASNDLYAYNTSWQLIGGGGGTTVTTSEGSHTHLANTTEQDVIEILNNLNETEVSLDMTLLLQQTTVRFFEEINDTAGYVEVSSALYPDDFTADGTVFIFNGKNLNQKITFQSIVAEAGSINVPFARVNVVRTT